MNRWFTKQEIQIASKHTYENILISLTIKMQIKSTLRLSLTPVRTVFIRKQYEMLVWLWTKGNKRFVFLLQPMWWLLSTSLCPSYLPGIYPKDHKVPVSRRHVHISDHHSILHNGRGGISPGFQWQRVTRECALHTECPEEKCDMSFTGKWMQLRESDQESQLVSERHFLICCF